MLMRYKYLEPVPLPEDMKEQILGHETIPGGHKTYGMTRTTSRPYTETDERKPYLPVQDTSIPKVEEGVSFRQAL